MSFTAFSTTTPQAGEEQPLSSTAGLVSSWTTLDISATFPPAKTPYSVSALIILGADLPSSGLLGKMRVRKFGSTTSYEAAPGALGITSIVYRNDGEYQSGGHTAIVTILVDTNGKFEYQLQNDSNAPRTIIRILEVTTVEEIQDSVPLTEKGAANGVASLNGSTLVVEDPANATATPTAGKIPKADGTGKLDAWVTIPSVPPAFKVVDTLTVEVSHTGDTIETVVHTAVVPADEMGANGTVRISALQCRPFANSSFNVYWGEVTALKKIGFWTHSVTFFLFARSIEVWNKNSVTAQGAGSASAPLILGQHFVAAGTPVALTEDTEQDVNIYFTIQNAVAGNTSYLYHVVTEVFHQD